MKDLAKVLRAEIKCLKTMAKNRNTTIPKLLQTRLGRNWVEQREQGYHVQFNFTDNVVVLGESHPEFDSKEQKVLCKIPK